MISKMHRFHGRAALSFVYRKGRVVRDRHCTLKYVANPRRQSYRVAVVASRKLSKSAVVRNRIRRRIYEQVRAVVPAAEPYDLVFTVYDDRLGEVSEKELNKTISKLLQMSAIGQGAEQSNTVDNSLPIGSPDKNHTTN